MGAVDAKSVADFEPSIIDENLTATEDGAGVDVTNSRGEAFIVDIETVNTSGDVTIKLQEKDPGGSWGDVADSDLDFSATSKTTNGFTLSGVSNPTKEVVGYTGDKSDLRLKVSSVNSSPDFETVMGILQYMPRNGFFNE